MLKSVYFAGSRCGHIARLYPPEIKVGRWFSAACCTQALTSACGLQSAENRGRLQCAPLAFSAKINGLLSRTHRLCVWTGGEVVHDLRPCACPVQSVQGPAVVVLGINLPCRCNLFRPCAPGRQRTNDRAEYLCSTVLLVCFVICWCTSSCIRHNPAHEHAVPSRLGVFRACTRDLPRICVFR